MNILSLERSQVVAMAESGLMRIESVRHWDICKALSEGKKIDEVAESFGLSSRRIDEIKQKKCYACS